MTKEQAKQKVLDAVADLATVELDASGDYLHFLTEVEEAVVDRVNQLGAQEVNRVLDPKFHVLTPAEIDALTAADLNIGRVTQANDTHPCGFGCGSACTGFGSPKLDHEEE